MKKTVEELRESEYHQQFARKLCAAFIAQQQGVRLDTAFKKVRDPIGDTWLIVAEFARAAALDDLSQQFPSSPIGPRLVV